jgi:hypothetical protein
MSKYRFKVSRWNREDKKFEDITSSLSEAKNLVYDLNAPSDEAKAIRKRAGRLALVYASRGYHVTAYEDVDRDAIDLDEDW